MNRKSQIQIHNIYYMLAYAFTLLKEHRYAKLESETFEHSADLLAAILAIGISGQTRRGLKREYLTQKEELSCPRGSIRIAESINNRSMLKRKLICEFDECSENTYLHQLLKTTMIILLASPDVSPLRKHSLRLAMRYFQRVDQLDPRRIQWTALTFQRHHTTDQLLIYICQLVLDGKLMRNIPGSDQMADFVDDRNMHILFEKFVLNYYKRHFPELKASAAQIEWNLDDDNRYLLPRMKTDIVLQYCHQTLIIDTKYYHQMLQLNRFKQYTQYSSNLYQMFAYVKNKDVNHTGHVKGMILYARTDQDLLPDTEYQMSGNLIYVRSLDLSGEFSLIEKQLKTIAETLF